VLLIIFLFNGKKQNSGPGDAAWRLPSMESALSELASVLEISLRTIFGIVDGRLANL
jgi:hypothetical protein